MGGITKTKYGLQYTTRFTNAQVIAWPTTPLVISPTPRSDLAILPLYFVFNLSPWFADYTNINVAATLDLLINSQPSTETLPVLPISQPFISQFLAFGDSHFDGFAIKFGDAKTANIAGFPVHARIQNGGAGNFTGGHASNVLVSTLFYATITIN